MAPLAAFLQGQAGGRVLLAVAAPAEARAVRAAFNVVDAAAEWTAARLDDRFDLVVTGVGKAAAAGGVARVLDTARHGLVLSVGIAGAVGNAAAVGSTVLATRCELADDGLQTQGRFEALESMGFGPFPPGKSSGADVQAEVIEALRPCLPAAGGGRFGVLGPIATVSLCCGTDVAARALELRGFAAEAMEGAAVALVAVRAGVPFGEVRIVSNTTGERSRQTWDLAGALSELTALLGRLRAC
ncbi:MAG: futalosine hydrolase [Phycisphaerales bacterium]|nr:futalosine hydrolase [Phycisphaerales bacterium]